MATEKELLKEVNNHYTDGFSETDTRATRQNGFNDVDEVLFGKLPDNWPYQTLVTDPRPRTALLEKTSRLFANPIKGRVNPREGGDVIGAKMHNSILEFQMQNEPEGSWIEKWALIDHQARKYGAAFWMDKWRYETKVRQREDEDGETEDVRYVCHDQPEMKVLNNRDVAVDPTATTIQEARWVQVRRWVTLKELERTNDAASSSPIYQNLSKLRDKMSEEQDSAKGSSRSTARTNKQKQMKGLNDAYTDEAFPEILIVTEYRENRWVEVAYDYDLVIRNIPTPYRHGELPVDMLKYYPVDDDLYGESELEPLLPIARAINALVCATYDEINTKLYTPLKIRATGVQIDTLEYGPDALWVMNDPATDVLPHEVSSKTLNHFQTMYTTLVQAFLNAMGELSQGISNLDDTKADKTATEINAVTKQQNARDNYNQLYLAEAIKRQMMRRISMNKQFLLSDPSDTYHVLRISGKDALDYFKRKGLGDMELTPQASEEISRILTEAAMMGQEISDDELAEMVEALMTPKHPVEMDEDSYSPKLVEDESEDGARLILTQEDLEGDYDYIADVSTMELGRGDVEKAGRAQAFGVLFGNETAQQMLAQEGKKFKATDILVQYLEDLGMKNAENLFEDINNAQARQQVQSQFNPEGAGAAPAGPTGGGNPQQPGLATGNSPAPPEAPPGPGGPPQAGGGGAGVPLS